MKMYEIENKIFMHPDEWEQWMKKLPNPTDDFQRARNHYLCRNFYESKLVKVFRNAAAFFLIPVLFIVLRLNHFKKQKKNKQASKADHFMNPRNVGEIENPDGVGEVGNAACGDALKRKYIAGRSAAIGVSAGKFICGQRCASSKACC